MAIRINKKEKEQKHLNSIDYILNKYNMDLTEIEIKILHKINEHKEGILLVNLAKATGIDRGNLSNYVNGLIAKGIVEEISKNPKLVKIVKLSYLGKINFVKCPKCKTIKIVPKTISYFKCDKCKKSIKIINKVIIGEIKEESIEKLTGLCYKYKLKSFDELADYLWLNNM